MSTLVLIHGACHGTWCWYKVLPRLQQLGYTVMAPDLPAHGRDHTPVESVTLQTYVDSVSQLLAARSEPVVLVGHSLGGLVISQVSEQRPDKVAKLVYVTAFLLAAGQTIMDIALADTESLLIPNSELSLKAPSLGDLSPLEKLTSLRVFRLGDEINAAQLARLKKALPNCKITYSQRQFVKKPR